MSESPGGWRISSQDRQKSVNPDEALYSRDYLFLNLPKRIVYQ
jgi:hypothetical protein